MAPNLEAIVTALTQRNILVWGSYGGVGRIRVSTHLYNDEEDVERFLTTLQEVTTDYA
jgi:selenocysteine lyase/cysteine desulfurase